MGSPRLKVILVVVAIILSIGSTAQAQIQVDVIGATGAIPRENFKSWSLFLICNPQWLSSERSSDLYNLYAQSRNFGRAIGDDHEAVWFWKSETSSVDQHLAEKVDVERSARFCKAFGIKPSASPSLLITSDYPDLARPTQNFAVFDLGDMKPNEISGLLAKITDQLLLQGRVSKPVPAPGVGTGDGLFIRILSAAQQILRSCGCAWSLKITGGPLEAKFNPCGK